MTTSGFSGRLFGPGITGAGVAVSAQWRGELLVLRADGVSQSISAQHLQIAAAGFNDQQIRLSWPADEGEYAFFIEQAEDRRQFLTLAPAALAGKLAAAGKQQRRTDSRFRSAILVYALVLASPLILLLLFLMHSGRLAGWVADKVPVRYEEKIGDLVLAQTRAQTPLLEQGPALDVVQSIGARLSAGSRYRYRWHVARGDQVNAFAAPGGVVVVYTGLIARTAQPEQLAGVLAHEIAHVEQRHSLKALVRNAGFGVLLSLALGDWSGTALGGWIANLTELKFSRDAELEADREGLKRLVAADIAPGPMADFFEQMADKEGDAARALSILSTHPSSPERTQALRRQIAALEQRDYAPLEVNWPAVQASLATRQ